MRTTLLRWSCKNYSFWNLPCYACGSCLGWRILSCSKRSNSFIANVICLKCNAKQFLKRNRSLKTESNAVLSEYQMLRKLDGGIRVGYPFLLPRAYNYSAENYSFSREFVEGESIDERLLRSENRQSFEDCLSASATWLRGLHEAPIAHLCSQGSDYLTMLRQLELDLGFLINSTPTVVLALGFMQSTLNKINKLTERHVPLHGDFKASNLIITSDGRVYGIDFSPRFNNPSAMDIAQFVVDLLLKRHQIKVLTRDIGIADIFDIFLKAYYGNLSQKNKYPITWWLLYFLFSHWKNELRSHKPKFLVNRYYMSILADIMAFCSNNLDYQ
ncbi:Phosphotransferase enzyme family protein [Nitrosomonas sp. Nm132]|nr:phosphotransferase [Nitrosomonas sp. Nm132]SDH23811.1 Phosphotransferase enzyme family protein [Nitrosomonas sp. Nm132]